MGNFCNLRQAAEQAVRLVTSDSTGVRPLAMGEDVVASLLVSTQDELVLHRQPQHEEVLVVVEGEADFRVGDEVRRVGPGDFIFVPRNAVHGTVAARSERFALLSILTPRIDLAKDVEWAGTQPSFRLV
jgi:mannose-6-phosphate isomerase-like protein (cupin superfamily)